MQAQSTVEYRLVEGFPGYRIGSDGTVWSCHLKGNRGGLTQRWRRLTPTVKDNGRLVVRLSPGRKLHLVHRLVLIAFVSPCPPGMQCCHGDGDPANNSLTNLRWGTPASNRADQTIHGTDAVGERHWNATLTEEQIRDVRAAYAAGGVSQRELGQRYGVCQPAIQRILSGERWASVT